MAGLAEIEKVRNRKFGDAENPLLVSVRSGAAISMPGMMDTVLNLGLNDKVVARWAEKSGNGRWVWDSYRRFVSMFSNIVGQLDMAPFEHLLEEVKNELDAKKPLPGGKKHADCDIPEQKLQEIAAKY